MKKIAALVGTVCLIIGFQNCSQSNLSPDGLDASLTGAGGESGKVTVIAPVVAIELSSAESSQWVIDISSGEIRYTSGKGEVSATRCLSSEDHASLKKILEEAKVCEASKAPADRICSQVYTSGYATLNSEDTKRVVLGESRDGCGSGQKELCGDQGEALRAFLNHVSQNLSNMVCQ